VIRLWTCGVFFVLLMNANFPRSTAEIFSTSHVSESFLCEVPAQHLFDLDLTRFTVRVSVTSTPVELLRYLVRYRTLVLYHIHYS
jgi:hypothetical protein